MTRTIYVHVITYMSFLLLKCVLSDHEGLSYTHPLHLNSNNTKIACKHLFDEEFEKRNEQKCAMPLTATTKRNVEEAPRKSNHINPVHRTTDFQSNTRQFGNSRNRQRMLERRMNENQQLNKRTNARMIRYQGGNAFPSIINRYGLQNDRWGRLDSRIACDGRMCVNRWSSVQHTRDSNIEYRRTVENDSNLIKRKDKMNGETSRQLITRRDESINLKLSDHNNIDCSTRDNHRRYRNMYTNRESQFRQEDRRGLRLESSQRLKLERMQSQRLERLPSERTDYINIEKREKSFDGEKNILLNTNVNSQRVRILTKQNGNNRKSDVAHRNDRILDQTTRTSVRYFSFVRTRAIRRSSVVRRERKRDEFRTRIQRRRDNSVHKHVRTEETRVILSSSDNLLAHRNERTNIRTRRRRIRFDDEGTHPVRTGERYSVRNRSVFVREIPEKGERRENIRNEGFIDETSQSRNNQDRSQDYKYRQRKHDNFISDLETKRLGQNQYDDRIRNKLVQKRYVHEQTERVRIVAKREQFKWNDNNVINMVDHIADDKQRLTEAPDYKMRRQTIDSMSRRIDGSKLLTGSFDIYEQNGITRAIVVGFVGIIGRGIWQKQC